VPRSKHGLRIVEPSKSGHQLVKKDIILSRGHVCQIFLLQKFVEPKNAKSKWLCFSFRVFRFDSNIYGAICRDFNFEFCNNQILDQSVITFCLFWSLACKYLGCPCNYNHKFKKSLE